MTGTELRQTQVIEQGDYKATQGNLGRSAADDGLQCSFRRVQANQKRRRSSVAWFVISRLDDAAIRRVQVSSGLSRIDQCEGALFFKLFKL